MSPCRVPPDATRRIARLDILREHVVVPMARTRPGSFSIASPLQMSRINCLNSSTSSKLR